ncbi:hypothetical protein PanWU01x14_335280 [Parasponia andersonii]|uniref:Uncharacterized protein n=1 Tax=Parasponia andersonii TaxID=3476 RepID=A0A2P5AGB3_PARAD|nr:hypothetical protein PanWU01x14_335280 [Parasponia andersonii]
MEEEKKKIEISVINDQRFDGEGYLGLGAHPIPIPIPIHSQVVKIKKEMEKISHPSLLEPEMRRVLLFSGACTRLRHTRSPLGLADPPIFVGN